MTAFNVLLSRAREVSVEFPSRLLCLDPGETTGWALFEDGKLTKWGQSTTKHSWEQIQQLFTDIQPGFVICENYRVYEHKLSRHANSEVFTIRLIGVIDYLCWLHKIPIVYQMAATAKGFCNDERLKEWDFWKEGMRHSRDAIRHGCHFLLFGKKIKEGKYEH